MIRFISPLFAITLAALPSVATAEAVKLSGAEIKDLLPTVTAYGEDTKQVFYKGGTTDYISGGRPSVGYWRVSETQYCSKWPPFGGWACYDVLLDADENELQWIGESGTPTLNRIEPRSAEAQ
jgi:hypothetical protein